MLKFSTQLRKMISDDGRTRYEICRLAKLDQAIMSKFMSGDGGLSLAGIDRLCSVLCLRLQCQRIKLAQDPKTLKFTTVPPGKLRNEPIRRIKSTHD
ncbi:MAG TPA: hypothetical protein VM487_14435 [Phycisphaerae bacterium]|nr:hypothetical protein [Phycisphaerae bacterium]